MLEARTFVSFFSSSFFLVWQRGARELRDSCCHTSYRYSLSTYYYVRALVDVLLRSVFKALKFKFATTLFLKIDPVCILSHRPNLKIVSIVPYYGVFHNSDPWYLWEMRRPRLIKKRLFSTLEPRLRYLCCFRSLDQLWYARDDTKRATLQRRSKRLWAHERPPSFTYMGRKRNLPLLQCYYCSESCFRYADDSAENSNRRWSFATGNGYFPCQGMRSALFKTALLLQGRPNNDGGNGLHVAFHSWQSQLFEGRSMDNQKAKRLVDLWIIQRLSSPSTRVLFHQCSLLAFPRTDLIDKIVTELA